jgi:hypothetical protein
MRFLTIFALFVFSIPAIAQTFSVEVDGDKIHVFDTSEPSPIPDTSAVEFIFHGDCWAWKTGKVPHSEHHIFDIVSPLEKGFSMQKITWSGFKNGYGGIKWTSQTSTCLRLYVPECVQTDTVFQVFNLDPIPGVPSPDWYFQSVNGGTVTTQETANNPGNVVIVSQVVTNSAGYVVGYSGGQMSPYQLLPGFYYCVSVLKIGGVLLIEQDGFEVF